MPVRKRELALTTSSSGEHVVVALEGVLDVSTADDLERTVSELLAPDVTIILDLTNLVMCDSTGLGALVRLHRRGAAAGARIAVRKPHQHIADLLMMTGINKVINVLPV